ncbi:MULTISPECIES: SDR family oxidoreductase [Actinoalloteichus]|uniref:SDR family oxidoreductase n=1 Tax=Actinoalloteichus TaxID=65496 RepID=UPI001E3BD7BA|nr:MULTISPECIES: NAD(P)H-binding protein [Actinoalloteichus]
MSETTMTLVIGATGHVGGQVAALLAENGSPVRALVHRPEARLPVGVEAVRGDLTDLTSLRAALPGVDAVFLVWPLGTPESAPAIMDVLHDSVRRVVFLSTLAVDDDLEEQDNAIGALHVVVEDAIRRSGLEWTFLRPAEFATNTLQWAADIRAGSVVRGAFGAAAGTLIHERDIAEVGVRALLGPGRVGRSHVLTGTQTLTQIEQVRILGEVIGRPLHWEELPPEAARERLLSGCPRTSPT